MKNIHKKFLDFIQTNHNKEVASAFERTFQPFGTTAQGNFTGVFASSEHYPFIKLIALAYYLQDLRDGVFESPDSPDSDYQISLVTKYYAIVEKFLMDALTDDDYNSRYSDDDREPIYKQKSLYGYANRESVGRLIPHSASMLVFPLDINYYFFSNHYTSFAIVNPVYNILCYYARAHYLSVPTLERFVHDQENFYQEVMLELNESEDFVDTLFRKCLFTEDFLTPYQTGQLSLLSDEILLIRECMYQEQVVQQSDMFLYIKNSGLALDMWPIATQYYYCLQKQTEIVLKFRTFLAKRLLLERESFVPQERGCLVIKPVFRDILEEFNSKIKPYELVEVARITGTRECFIDESCLSRYYAVERFLQCMSMIFMFTQSTNMLLGGVPKDSEELFGHRNRRLRLILTNVPPYAFDSVVYVLNKVIPRIPF